MSKTSSSATNPRKFKNPLLQSTEAGIPEAETATPELAPLSHKNEASALQEMPTGLNAFERRNVRMTTWIERTLKARLDALVDQTGSSRNRLLHEAITDLLRKYKAS